MIFKAEIVSSRSTGIIKRNGLKMMVSVWILFILSLVSCNSKPTDKDIQNKLLSEYVCPETAVIRHFEIVQHDEIKNDHGGLVHRFLVKGQVEWPKGCSDSGIEIRAGRQQSFEQTVFLTKDDGQWR